MSEETRIGAAVRNALKKEQYDGPEKRVPQSNAIGELMKLLPLVAAVVAGSMAYGSLHTDVDHLQKAADKRETRIDKAFDDQREMNAALWKAIRE